MVHKSVRKKPQQARSKAVLESILEASTSILNSGITKHFTTNQIAKKAGVSIGSLYQYFPNKETILDQILQLIVKKMTQDFRDMLYQIEASSYEEFIGAFIDFSFETCMQNPHLMRQTFHIEKSDETIRLIFDSRQHLVEEFCQVVRRQFGDFKDLEAKAFLSFHGYMGLIEALVSSSKGPDRKKVIEIYKKTILAMTEL